MSGTELEEPGQLKRAVIDASAGAVAGVISRMVTSPLDVSKIRFQVQLEPTASWALTKKDSPLKPKYNGLFRTTKDIFREEGLSVSLLVDIVLLKVLTVFPYAGSFSNVVTNAMDSHLCFSWHIFFFFHFR
ncbi:unnamed protein product [Arabidopsis halleri]